MKELCEENYFSLENEMKYTGSSQIKSFLKCEACALAKLRGEWIEEQTESMAISSYIDAVVSGQEEEFLQKEIEKINNKEKSYILLKSGKKTAKVIQSDEVIAQMQQDEMFMKYLNGEHQIIMTGEISGVPFKIKMDSFHKKKAIVDLKAMANLDLIWNDKTRQRENFIDAYDYVLQRSIISTRCMAKHRRLITIYNSCCNKAKIQSTCFVTNSARKASFKITIFTIVLTSFARFKTRQS